MVFIRELAQSGVLAVLVAFVGLVFTYSNSRSLARQGEANSVVATLEKMLQEIADENYKFWRDISDEDGEHEMRCRLFHAYIFYRCNFIEDKILHLSGKCKSFFYDHLDYSGFESGAIDIVSDIRHAATYNSENPELVKDRVARVLLINKHTGRLFGHVHEFLRLRYSNLADVRDGDF